jgi:manganese efflux pump family protein
MHEILTLALVCLALSTDAFAAALARGAQQRTHSAAQAMRVGSVFGLSEGLMFLLGWWLAHSIAAYAEAFDHWIALALLATIGTLMVREGLRAGPDEVSGDNALPRRNTAFGTILTAIATSIDAAAVGVAMALAGTSAWLALAIGLTSFLVSALGFSIGPTLGVRFGQRAEIGGGLVLIAIGASIFYSHMTGG